jgi:hypothetical protein
VRKSCEIESYEGRGTRLSGKRVEFKRGKPGTRGRHTGIFGSVRSRDRAGEPRKGI